MHLVDNYRLRCVCTPYERCDEERLLDLAARSYTTNTVCVICGRDHRHSSSVLQPAETCVENERPRSRWHRNRSIYCLKQRPSVVHVMHTKSLVKPNNSYKIYQLWLNQTHLIRVYIYIHNKNCLFYSYVQEFCIILQCYFYVHNINIKYKKYSQYWKRSVMKT